MRIDADGILTYMVDASGRHHQPAGRPDGGQFTSDASYSHSSVPKDSFQDAATFGEAIASGLAKAPGASEAKQRQYIKAAKSVAAKLTLNALDYLRANLKTIRVCKSLAEVKNQYEKAEGTKIEAGRIVCGYFEVDTGTLVMDGPIDDDDEWTVPGILAHELGHGLDAVGGYAVNSQHPAFLRCYEAEIKDGQLSDYAATDEVEAFAEFTRLLHGSDVRREEVAAKFPMTLRYFQSIGFA